MTVSKVDDSFYDITNRKMNNLSQLKLFNIFNDYDDTKFMNIFKSYSVDDNVKTNIVYYDTYEVGHDEWWENISNKIYGTPYLWWVIALINNVSNPFEELEVGDSIKILKSDLLYILMKDIERIADL